MPPTRRAFTLVELLVVIAIISVLAALLMPALEESMKAARRAACASRHKQIYTALTLYASDHADLLPPTGVWGTGAGLNLFADNRTVTESTLPGKLRWWGIGLLVWNQYLTPEDRVVWCPGYVDHWHHSHCIVKNDTWNFPAVYAQAETYLAGGDPGYLPGIVGNMILNTAPYYVSDHNPAGGRIGSPGCRGGYSDPWFPEVDHITSLMLCMGDGMVKPTGGSAKHEGHHNEGVNCTYHDGHVRWLPQGHDWWVRVKSTGHDGYTYGHSRVTWNYGFWNWATWLDS